MHRRTLLLAGLALATGCESPRTEGPKSGSFRVGARAIPLPPGEWREIGRADTPILIDSGQITHRTVLMAQEDKGRLASLAVASATLPGAGNLRFYNVGNSFPCRQDANDVAPGRRDILEQSFDCRRVLGWVPASDGRGRDGLLPAWQEFVARRDADPAWAPLRGHTVTYGLADRGGQMTVAYAFSPETRGLLRDARPWPQNGWNPANQGTAQRQYVARLVAWADAADPQVRRGFANSSALGLPAF
jgi:hypothetical protein